jgi:hypothetical protein
VPAFLETALREAREEMLLATEGRPHLIQRGHVKQVGAVGQFEWGVDDPRTRNVEYSTAFVLCDGFADGLGRILHSVLKSPEIREDIEAAINCGTTHVF